MFLSKENLRSFLKQQHEREHRNKTVFTNGVFDLVTANHVMLLRWIKFRFPACTLIVGINSDESAARIKPGRPFKPMIERSITLDGLKHINFITAFDEDTPEELIKLIRPDVIVKGGDYKDKPIAGEEFVKQYGGTVALTPKWTFQSTSAIIERIKNAR